MSIWPTYEEELEWEREHAREEGREEGREQVREEAIAALMVNLKITREKALLLIKSS